MIGQSQALNKEFSVCLVNALVSLPWTSKVILFLFVYLQIPFTETPFSSISNDLCVASIDFGTTFSGYAYASCPSNPNNMYVSIWPAGCGGLISHKTPTTVLLDNDTNFIAFGFDAETAYSKLCDNGEHEEYYYFHRFKMLLYDKVRTSVRNLPQILDSRYLLNKKRTSFG